jgi:Uma2 family endonuclease
MDTAQREPKRWTRTEYDFLVAQGAFQPHERLELIDGDILTMTPQNRPHATTVMVAQDVLRQSFGPGCHVQVQLPLAVSPTSEPEPDLAVIPGSPRDYVGHPQTAKLVVEVFDTTLAFDRKRKGPLYARAGIQEYWIVDLTSDAVEVCRDPGEQGYCSIERLVRGQTIRPLARPDIVLAVTDFLPPV